MCRLGASILGQITRTALWSSLCVRCATGVVGKKTVHGMALWENTFDRAVVVPINLAAKAVASAFPVHRNYGYKHNL